MSPLDIIEVILYGVAGLYYVFLLVICLVIVSLIKKRQWIGSLILFVSLIVALIPGILLEIVPGSFVYHDPKRTKELTGRAFLLGFAKISRSSNRSFHGDGYSIDIYSISGRTAEYFMNPPNGFFEDYPIRPSYRSDWKAVPWRKTPQRSLDSDFIRFVSLSTGDWGLR